MSRTLAIAVFAHCGAQMAAPIEEMPAAGQAPAA
jgi:hypothetical protein